MDQADMLLALIGGPDAVSRAHQGHLRSGHALPAHGRLGRMEDVQVLERAGVVLGERVPGRLPLRQATLPTGWSIRSEAHPIYSALLDEKGRKRATVMLHWQDQEAWVAAETRFQATSTVDDPDDRNGPSIPCIKDSDGRQLWRGLPVPALDRDSDPLWFEKPRPDQVASSTAAARLDLLAPGWQSPDAWWGPEGDAIQWPPHETPPDQRPTYVLWVEFRRGGSCVDSGDHRSARAADDREAVAKLLESVPTGYDETRWVVRCGDRKVDEGVKYRPRPKRSDPYGMFRMGHDGRPVRLDEDDAGEWR